MSESPLSATQGRSATSGHQAYRTVEVQSSDPRMLVVMLFQAAVRKVLRARQALGEGQWEEKHTSISRAQEILQHLSLALDETRAPELAPRLAGLYAHLDRVLAEANLDNDADKLDYVLEILTKLAEAWQEAVSRCS